MTMYQNPSNPLMGGGLSNTGLYSQTPMATGPTMQQAYPGSGVAHTNVIGTPYAPQQGGTPGQANAPWGGQMPQPYAPGGGHWNGAPSGGQAPQPYSPSGDQVPMGGIPGQTEPLPPGGGHLPQQSQQGNNFHPWWGGFQGGMLQHHGSMPSWPSMQGGQMGGQQWGSPSMPGAQPMGNFQQPMFNMNGQGF